MARIDSRELAEWMAFFKLENEDMEAAQAGKGTPAEQTPEQQIGIAKQFTKAIDQRKRQW